MLGDGRNILLGILRENLQLFKFFRLKRGYGNFFRYGFKPPPPPQKDALACKVGKGGNEKV